MKKVLSLLLILGMLFGASSAVADNERKSGMFKYTIKGNGTATITGYTGRDEDIILPNLIDGYTITTIGEGAFATERLNHASILVTIPETITAIEANAFVGRNVNSINLPDALEYIGEGAFAGCAPDIHFRLSNNHPRYATIDGALYEKAAKKLIRWVVGADIPEGINEIADYAFASISKYDARVHIPSSVSMIGVKSFYDCDGLVISFAPDCSVEEIPEWTFGGKDYHNRTLSNLPNGIKKIGEYAFCYSTIRTPLGDVLKNAEYIGANAFLGCTLKHSEAEIDIPSNCKVIGESAFEKFIVDGTASYSTAAINLAQGVERIESKAFLVERQGFFSVYLPESLKYIAYDAFNEGTTYVVEKGSYAERWAKENAFTYSVNGEEQNLDWLYN